MFRKQSYALAVMVLGVAGTASASPFLEVPVDEASVDACVAEIEQHANYAGARRVLHDVEVEQRRSIGHELKITTTILSEPGGAPIRAYATECVVTPRRAPARFRIREVQIP